MKLSKIISNNVFLLKIFRIHVDGARQSNLNFKGLFPKAYLGL